MITDAIPCQTCYHYEIHGHTHCTCGQANPGASGEVKEQLFKNVVSIVSQYSRRAHLFPELGNFEGKQLVAAKAPSCIAKRVITSRVPRRRGNTSILDRYQEDERYRDNLQSEGITKERVK